MVTGAAMVLIWHNLIKPLGGIFGIYELLPAFLLGCLAIFIVSKLTPEPDASILYEFDHYMDGIGAKRDMEAVLEENMAADLPETPATSFPQGRKE